MVQNTACFSSKEHAITNTTIAATFLKFLVPVIENPVPLQWCTFYITLVIVSQKPICSGN
jgi:hypothetical protein